LEDTGINTVSQVLFTVPAVRKEPEQPGTGNGHGKVRPHLRFTRGSKKGVGLIHIEIISYDVTTMWLLCLIWKALPEWTDHTTGQKMVTWEILQNPNTGCIVWPLISCIKPGIRN